MIPIEARSLGAPGVGSILEDRYELLAPIGIGGIGTVFRAKHLKLGHHVAIKVLNEQFIGNPAMLPRFELEARALAELVNPHIVTLTDYLVVDGRAYIVMEMLEGSSLADVIAEGPMSEARARPILRQVLVALTFAHERGFIHRDLKPDNIFLTTSPPDFVKVLDFGFVKLIGASFEETSSPSLTPSGIVFGTPAYMSPEQIAGDRAGPSSDIYSFGIVVSELLTGRRPFVGEPTDVVRQHLTTPLPDVRVIAGEAGPEFRAFLAKATAKRPEDRFTNGIDALVAFDALPERWMHVSDEVSHAKTLISEPPPRASTPAPSPPSSPSTVRAAVRERMKIAILSAAVFAATIAALARAFIDQRSMDAYANRLSVAVDGSVPDVESFAASIPATRAVFSLGPSPSTSRPPVALIAAAESKVERGEPLDPDEERAIDEWARDHGDDPRPHLVLAIERYNHRDFEATLARIAMAHQAAPDARNDPRMLELLIRLAGSRDANRAAANSVISIYGPIAKPVIRAEIDRIGLAPATAARLEALERRL